VALAESLRAAWAKSNAIAREDHADSLSEALSAAARPSDVNSTHHLQFFFGQKVAYETARYADWIWSPLPGSLIRSPHAQGLDLGAGVVMGHVKQALSAVSNYSGLVLDQIDMVLQSTGHNFWVWLSGFVSCLFVWWVYAWTQHYANTHKSKPLERVYASKPEE